MNILILTPTALPDLTGNALTAERWRNQLTDRGESVAIVATRNLTSRELIEVIEQFHPQLIHVHHLTKAGHFLLDPGVRAHVHCPVVVSPGGTDLVDQQGRWQLSLESQTLCRQAAAIVVQNPATDVWLAQHHPDLHARSVFIAKGVAWLGHEPFNLHALFSTRHENTVPEGDTCESASIPQDGGKSAGKGIPQNGGKSADKGIPQDGGKSADKAATPDGSTLFFLPAGVRPVKNNLTCVIAFSHALRERPLLRLVLAGPPLDHDYAALLQAHIEPLAGSVRWIEGIAPDRMAGAYASSDVVINCSLSEGLANSVLEAVYAERPLLAADIPGNRGVLFDPLTGASAAEWFDPRSPDQLADRMIALADAPDYRAQLARKASTLALTLPSSAMEGEALLRLYRTLTRTRSPAVETSLPIR